MPKSKPDKEVRLRRARGILAREELKKMEKAHVAMKEAKWHFCALWERLWACKFDQITDDTDIVLLSVQSRMALVGFRDFFLALRQEVEKKLIKMHGQENAPSVPEDRGES